MSGMLDTFEDIKVIINNQYNFIVSSKSLTKSSKADLIKVLKQLVSLIDLDDAEIQKAFNYIEGLDYETTVD